MKTSVHELETSPDLVPLRPAGGRGRGGRGSRGACSDPDTSYSSTTAEPGVMWTNTSSSSREKALPVTPPPRRRVLWRVRASDLMRNAGGRPDARNNLTATHIPTAKPTAPNTTPASMRPDHTKPHLPSHRPGRTRTTLRGRAQRRGRRSAAAVQSHPSAPRWLVTPLLENDGIQHGTLLRGERMAVALHQLPAQGRSIVCMQPPISVHAGESSC